jgi:hypothetical protein
MIDVHVVIWLARSGLLGDQDNLPFCHNPRSDGDR